LPIQAEHLPDTLLEHVFADVVELSKEKLADTEVRLEPGVC
jgi:hypothetical protein